MKNNKYEKKVLSKSKVHGIVSRRLFDTLKFISLINELGVEFKYKTITSHTFADAFSAAVKYGLSKAELDTILDKSAKPMFRDNRLWRFFKKHFSRDFKIPLIFGNWTTQAIKLNTITDVGLQVTAKQVNGVTTAPVTAIAIGVGTPSTTALGSESTTNGGSRGAATTSNQTTTSTGDTARWVKTFTFTGSLSLTEEGLFDNNSSGGNMLASQSFSTVAVVNTDTLQVTHDVVYNQ